MLHGNLDCFTQQQCCERQRIDDGLVFDEFPNLLSEAMSIARHGRQGVVLTSSDI